MEVEIKEDEDIKEEVGELYADTISYTPIDYDFSEKKIYEEWKIALDLTDEEIENEEYIPMMNYLYPLPVDFEKDMENRFGDEWRSEIKDQLVSTTVIYLIDEDRYYLALTGGGMDLSWDICESYINLGYLPPIYFCDLPLYAGMDYKNRRNKRIIYACLRSISLSHISNDFKKQKLEGMLKEG